MKTIVERIKEYLEFKGVSPSSAELKIAVSNGTLSKPFNSGTTIKTNTLEKFLNIYNDINPEWLLTGNGLMIKDSKNIIAEPIKSHRKTLDPIYELQRIPVFNLDASMGLVPQANGSGIDEEKIIDYISLGMLPSCDGAVSATGDSMYPLLKAGDLVAYKSVSVDRNNIFFGEMYLLAIHIDETTTMKTIKFIHPSELGDEYIKIVSHNQYHASKDVKISQIAAMGLVRASIRIHN